MARMSETRLARLIEREAVVINVEDHVMFVVDNLQEDDLLSMRDALAERLPANRFTVVSGIREVLVVRGERVATLAE